MQTRPRCTFFIPPNCSSSLLPMYGRKKDRKHLTSLLGFNAAGNENFPVLYLGTAPKPHCFKKSHGKDHGFDYANNAKAYMSSSMFVERMERFNNYISQTDGCPVLLLQDNFSGHGRKYGSNHCYEKLQFDLELDAARNYSKLLEDNKVDG